MKYVWLYAGMMNLGSALTYVTDPKIKFFDVAIGTLFITMFIYKNNKDRENNNINIEQ